MENNEYISQISEGMIINSQNDRIAGAGRDLKRSESPTPLLKQEPYYGLHR